MPTITNRHPMPGALLLLALLALLVPCTSCRQDLVTPEAGDAFEPFPGTQRQLMTSFVAAHESRDFAAYRSLLRDDYVMLIQPATQEEFPDLGPTFDHKEDLRATERMFSGENVVSPDGNLIPAADAISFEVFEQVAPWTAAEPTGPFPGSSYAVFEVMILIYRPGRSTLRTDGMLKIWVASREVMHAGQLRTYWEIAGIQDLTNGGGKQAVESLSWGAIKALWR